MKKQQKYIECLFIKEMDIEKEESPMTDVCYFNCSAGLDHIKAQLTKGITHFLLFGVPKVKSVIYGSRDDAIIPSFIRKAKSQFGDSVTIYADVGLSPYREDGHSTVLRDGFIDEAESYHQASLLAVSFAKAGADYIAPCLSLPKQVAKLRAFLDEHHYATKIMAYSSKFSSTLYGPYRETIQSTLGKQKKSYQTDQSDSVEALRQLTLDEKQGADIVMVKPGTFYLDILNQAKEHTSLPVAVYHVSGEYMMMKLACAQGYVDEDAVFDEIHTAFARCGADYIIGYAPDHFLRWLGQSLRRTL